MIAAVRDALRRELKDRGYSVARDTAGLREVLYIQGDGDRAAALFEFKTTVEEAIDTMYQGSWLPDIPPRFAVLPSSQKDNPELELLGQAGLSVLLYEASDGIVVFRYLEAVLPAVMRRSG